MATESIVGGLDAILSECQLKLEYAGRARALRQAAQLRYGPLPMSFLQRPSCGGFDIAGFAPPKLHRSNVIDPALEQGGGEEVEGTGAANNNNKRQKKK